MCALCRDIHTYFSAKPSPGKQLKFLAFPRKTSGFGVKLCARFSHAGGVSGRFNRVRRGSA